MEKIKAASIAIQIFLDRHLHIRWDCQEIKSVITANLVAKSVPVNLFRAHQYQRLPSSY